MPSRHHGSSTSSPADVRGDDPTPWTLLQDGTIVGVAWSSTTVLVTVEQPRLRATFGGVGRRFVLTLERCTALQWEPADEPPITEPAFITASEPQILDARTEPGIGTVRPAILVACAGGILRLRYAQLAIALDTGAPVELADLRARSSVVTPGTSTSRA